MSHADPYNIWAGNPNLNPELTHSIELGDIWYGQATSLSGTIYYRHTDSVITRIRTIDQEGVAKTIPRNLNTSDAIGLEFTFGTSLAKWWKVNGSANYYHQTTDGTNLDSSYTASFFSYSARLMSLVNLWKGSTLQVMANYRGPEESPQGVRLAMVFFDIGLKQDVLKSKGTLTLKAVDPFNTHKFRFRTVGDNYTIDSQFQRHARGFVLNFTYKLNNFRQRERQNGDQYQMEEIGF
jgi:outer membrane receptor protein involved in Fe transport